MTLPSHILLGMIVGKVTGNYALAIATSIIPDVDHLNSYVKSGVISNWDKFRKTVFDREDPYGDQRGYLHNVLVWGTVSTCLYFWLNTVALPIIFGWLGHLILDALDNSEYWPFFPNKKISIRGPIKYASFQELMLSVLLVIVYITI